MRILYPPLIHAIKLEVCLKNKFFDTPIAREYIYIDEISNPTFKTDSLPTFGPSVIDLYDEPYYLIFNRRHQYAEFPNDKELADNGNFKSSSRFQSNPSLSRTHFKPKSESLVSFNGAGVNEYLGRLLLHIDSRRIHKIEGTESNTNILNSLSYSAKCFHPKRKFTVFACINEANMIDKRFRNSVVTFKLTTGFYGHSFDSVSSYLKSNSKPIPLNQLSKDTPIYATFGKVKPCLYLDFEIEDTIHILHKINFLKHKTKQLVSFKLNAV